MPNSPGPLPPRFRRAAPWHSRRKRQTAQSGQWVQGTGVPASSRPILNETRPAATSSSEESWSGLLLLQTYRRLRETFQFDPGKPESCSLPSDGHSDIQYLPNNFGLPIGSPITGTACNAAYSRIGTKDCPSLLVQKFLNLRPSHLRGGILTLFPVTNHLAWSSRGGR